MPAIVKEPMKLWQGVPYARSITLAANGVPVDLTGRKVTANLHRGGPNDPGAAAYTISTDNGLLSVSDPTTGRIDFALAGSDIAGFKAGGYTLHLFVLDADDNVIAQGYPLIRYVQVSPSGVNP